MQATGWTYEQIGELDLWQVREIGRQMKLDAKIAQIARKPGLNADEVRAGIEFLLDESLTPGPSPAR